jgi:hypothetical protein
MTSADHPGGRLERLPPVRDFRDQEVDGIGERCTRHGEQPPGLMEVA